MNTRGNGTAGGVYYELEVTNLSRHPCATGGYPGVSAVDLAGRQIGSAARRGGGTPASFKLAHGQSAVAALRIVDAGNFPPSSCSVTIAAGLRVYPPNDRSSKIVPFPFAACAKTADRVLQIGPLMRPSA